MKETGSYIKVGLILETQFQQNKIYKITDKYSMDDFTGSLMEPSLISHFEYGGEEIFIIPLRSNSDMDQICSSMDLILQDDLHKYGWIQILKEVDSLEEIQKLQEAIQRINQKKDFRLLIQIRAKGENELQDAYKDFIKRIMNDMYSPHMVLIYQHIRNIRKKQKEGLIEYIMSLLSSTGLEKDISDRNYFLSDIEIDPMIPGLEEEELDKKGMIYIKEDTKKKFRLNEGRLKVLDSESIYTIKQARILDKANSIIKQETEMYIGKEYDTENIVKAKMKYIKERIRALFERMKKRGEILFYDISIEIEKVEKKMKIEYTIEIKKYITI